MKTACGKCQWIRHLFRNYYCASGDIQVFDSLSSDDGKVFNFLSGEMIPKRDAVGLFDVAGYTICLSKNKGNCPDFTPIPYVEVDISDLRKAAEILGFVISRVAWWF